VEIIYPVFAMVLLTAVVVFILGRRRMAAVRNRAIDPAFFRAYYHADEPESLRVTSRHLINLFETPVLFYVAIIMIHMTGESSTGLVVIAWLYVAARYLHSYVHLTSNTVIVRFRLFLVSWLLLLSLWVIFAIRLLT